MIELTARGSGYYRVWLGPDAVSQHVTEREAIESAVRTASAHPDAAVEITHDYRVTVETDAAAPVEAAPKNLRIEDATGAVLYDDLLPPDGRAVVVTGPVPPAVNPPAARIMVALTLAHEDATERRIRVEVRGGVSGAPVRYTVSVGGLTPSRVPTLSRALGPGGEDDTVWYLPLDASGEITVESGGETVQVVWP